jgi:hypothetical protein
MKFLISMIWRKRVKATISQHGCKVLTQKLWIHLNKDKYLKFWMYLTLPKSLTFNISQASLWFFVSFPMDLYKKCNYLKTVHWNHLLFNHYRHLKQIILPRSSSLNTISISLCLAKTPWITYKWLTSILFSYFTILILILRV